MRSESERMCIAVTASRAGPGWIAVLIGFVICLLVYGCSTQSPESDATSVTPARSSVGRGWPVEPVGDFDFVGAGVAMYNYDYATARGGKAPEGVVPLKRDIFTSDDFYIDRELWKDRRYFRCNAPLALDSQWGDYSTAPKYITNNDPATGAWGHCDRDYPREAIVSPYPFASAMDHYNALLDETARKGRPGTQPTAPPDLEGRYRTNLTFIYAAAKANTERAFPAEYHAPPEWMMGNLNQLPTMLSLLTPEYQQRLVQQFYHQAHNNAAQWSAMFCRPEGFMRWWSAPGGPGQLDFTVTPKRVQLLGGSGNAIRNIHIGRSFNTSGNTPNLGGDVPRWFGESIGFWDGEVLISWTSNIQGWFSHGSFEHSSKLQTIEIWTPRRRANHSLVGLEHEAIFYDPEALVQPIRAVRFFSYQGDYNTLAPIAYAHCNQTIYPINGRAAPVAPGTVIQHRVPDLYGRPWAQIWEEYFEKGMKKPESEDIFAF